MRNRSLILLLVLLLFSCTRKERFELLFAEDITLGETSEHYLTELPVYLTPFNSNVFYLVNDEKELLFFSSENGKLTQVLNPNFSIDRFLENENKKDSTVKPFKLEELSDAFIETYPRYNIYGHSNNKGNIEMFYRVTNPVMANNTMLLNFVSLLLEMDSTGNCTSHKKILTSTSPKSVSLVPFSGFYFNSDSSVFYSNSVCEDRFEVIVSAYGDSEDGYINIWNKAFPFPFDLNKSKVVDRSKPNTFYALCDFKKMGDSLYFLNGKDIFNFFTGRKVIAAEAFTLGDSIHFIESFVILPSKDETPAYFAYTEYVLPETDDYENTKCFLVVRSAKKGKIVSRIPIASKISGLLYQNGYLIFLEMKEEHIVLKKYKVTYKL